MIGKCLHPLPDKWQGLSDPEAGSVSATSTWRSTSTTRERAGQARARSVRSLRDTFDGRGFLEVETPMLQTSTAAPTPPRSSTHINAYDLDLYLRIAPELYLKRLMVGGMDKVFEIGRNFRNEGVDATHNPEFTIAGGLRGATATTRR